MKPLIILLAATFNFSVLAAWELNDVSYLYPLASNDADKAIMLKPEMAGKRGELLPFSMSEHFESDLIISINRPESSYKVLKTVGVRIDDCFKFSNNPDEKCSPQIRIVWQPILAFGTKDVSSFDAALHTFYNLTENEFYNLKIKLQELKTKYSLNTSNLPLGVHPGFKTKNKIKFSKDLNSIILSYCGKKNLTRLTFMKMVTENIWWSFGGVDIIQDNTWAPIIIPRMTDSDIKQDFFNDGFNDPVGMRGSIVPGLKSKEDNLSDIVIGQNLYNEELKLETFKNAVLSWNRIQNPRVLNNNNLDCVHCHIAHVAQTWAEIKHPETLNNTNTNLMKYTQNIVNRHNLNNVTNRRDTTKSLRSFGYFNNSPSINQRVINESAEVADALNNKSEKSL